MISTLIVAAAKKTAIPCSPFANIVMQRALNMKQIKLPKIFVRPNEYMMHIDIRNPNEKEKQTWNGKSKRITQGTFPAYLLRHVVSRRMTREIWKCRTCAEGHSHSNKAGVSWKQKADCWQHKTGLKMIPPNASLVKYDNPVLVSRNTDKKTPRVSPVFHSSIRYF